MLLIYHMVVKGLNKLTMTDGLAGMGTLDLDLSLMTRINVSLEAQFFKSNNSQL